ncbi:AraC family transcriptional regulator ligand-binding domain-containing protein [Nocardia jejuensis]|uniref:AraC family transcriptional regulator ligand-binding domain-containing protein n=1 Tax=Nocardia jejuensis TaxID=328049 RepID=UPI00082A7981|nr:AraC family transcriptional regulator ligand-binding domain-containing protein [Nocardia jejuensis]
MIFRPECADSILLPRFVLRRAEQAGLDPDRLAGLAGVPGWREGGEATRVSSRCCTRVWELFEQATGDPNLALHSAESTVGELGLLEYLFLASGTLEAALAGVVRHCGTLTTGYSLRISESVETEATYEIRSGVEEGRGRDLIMQAFFALLVGRTRWATRSPVDPVRLSFRQAAPDSRHAFERLFRSKTIDFGAPVDSITLRRCDLGLPLKTADADLARVLHDYAATLPGPATFAITWTDRLAPLLDAGLADGTATLDAVARRLLMSPRSLQRRLAEAGTSWRREIELARRRRLERAGHLPRTQQAEYLGYADPASLRRAVHRWRESGDQ